MAELRKRANESRRYQQELKDSQYHLIAARETANLLQQQLMNPSSAAFKFEMDEMTRTYKGLPSQAIQFLLLLIILVKNHLLSHSLIFHLIVDWAE